MHIHNPVKINNVHFISKGNNRWEAGTGEYESGNIVDLFVEIEFKNNNETQLSFARRTMTVNEEELRAVLVFITKHKPPTISNNNLYDQFLCLVQGHKNQDKIIEIVDKMIEEVSLAEEHLDAHF